MLTSETQRATVASAAGVRVAFSGAQCAQHGAGNVLDARFADVAFSEARGAAAVGHNVPTAEP